MQNIHILIFRFQVSNDFCAHVCPFFIFFNLYQVYIHSVVAGKYNLHNVLLESRIEVMLTWVCRIGATSA